MCTVFESVHALLDEGAITEVAAKSILVNYGR